ncbi:two-component system histidine kinase PnpS [Oceanobacillus halotolerans]|uniref:two-component system histidine kinase PnpS n=1 Tax=Oceanobacillus halotolerans TaxID=2663380 RepID=UPI0013DC3674
MKKLFSRALFSYVLGIFVLLIVSGVILNQVVSNYVVLIAVLLTVYIVLLLMLLHVFDKYIKPIKKATKTVGKLVEGNYRARMHHPSYGSIGELSSRINQLARNLSELSIHEQMQSEQLATVFDNTVSGLVHIDQKGYIHLVNRKFLTMFGKKAKDYKGYLYYEVIPNEKIHETVQKAFLYEENVKESITHYKGIDKFYLEIVGAPIFNDRNMLKGAVLVIYDITEMKKLELTRKDFVANVSHELKTPITSIKGFSETLLDGAMDDEEARQKFIRIIYKESQRLQLLIEDLLTLSKLEKEEFQLNIVEVDVKQLLQDITPIMQSKAAKKNINVTINIDSDSTVKIDEDRVKQVILNLLDNAISYTPEDGNITLQVDEVRDQLHIRVSDTGIGIEQEALPRIFERFYRIDKARSRNTGGTGLGLAIAKHIVDVHDGKITVDSKVNEGTTFDVYLPKETAI